MKKWNLWLATALLCISAHGTLGEASPKEADVSVQPTCVLMKFSNDTRFKGLDAENLLSDLVMEKLIASGKFRLKETKPLREETEALLYDEKRRATEGMEAAVEEDDFNALFDGPGFNPAIAESIAVAEEGQIVTPSITSEIGRAHGAEYLIQGTIINAGRGSWANEATEYAKMGIGSIGQLLGGAAGGLLQGIAGSVRKTDTGVGILSDMRIIKASTGEVVWRKPVVAIYTQDKTDVGGIGVGSDKLHMDLFTKAMDQAAQKIVDELIADMNKGKLFVK